MASTSNSSSGHSSALNGTSTKTLAISTRSNSLSEEQNEILNKLRSDIIEEGHLKIDDSFSTDDETLIRFLKARKFNLNLTKRMITQCLQWRNQVEGVGIDHLYREIDPFDYPKRYEVFKYWPMYYHRIDKLGRPISIQRFGALDLNKLYEVIDKETHFKTLIVNCEALTREVLPACSHLRAQNQRQRRQDSSSSENDPATNNNCSSSLIDNGSETKRDSSQNVDVSGAFCIVDLKGFSLGQFWHIKGIARTCISISQDYYPETMGYLALINVPRSFTAILKAIQPWLSPETFSKIKVMGEDYQSTLLEHIDENNLPNYLGGKCNCDESEPWRCESGNQSVLEQSPWLKGRDWKNQSWKSFSSGTSDDRDLQRIPGSNGDSDRAERKGETNGDSGKKSGDEAGEPGGV
ncbi:CRAL-TRIO domain-containing protein [Phakopsora pachyrhizi]|uniref:CRAL-TRIO domain-containing protein n=1 Tax=Phakopsora pachyrhizi TaxID=170000 RepID=A0AAV0BM14_PHAPC|nr:CRAL-TRIO domain-containing protein [Phakopsora pachyrhizi]CAH7687370.1 CRAL-TRIO domain-containing protein [Phakopsora pachyrhizi]